MNYTLSDLKRKEVVETRSGIMLGRVDDIEICADNSTVKSMIVYGRPKLFGILGRDNDIIISNNQIDLIGRDAILVSVDNLSDITMNTAKENKFLFK